MNSHTSIIRHNDNYYIDVELNIDYSNFDNCVISFSDGYYIVSSNAGHIIDNTVSVTKTSKVVVRIKHESALKGTECFVSYYINEELQHFDSIIIDTSDINSITDTNISVDNIDGSMTSIFEQKMETFYSVLNKKKPDFSLKIDIDNDIIINIINAPKDSTYISFGEITESLLSSDIILSLYHNIKQIIIPKEIIWKTYDQYSSSSDIGCCKIVSPSFCSIKNNYYKIIVSNKLTLSDLPRYKQSKLSDFYDPMNRPFNNKWTLSKFCLPVYKVET